MELYKHWVRSNKEFVRSLESLANGLTWLLPERFSNSEIGPEAVYAFLGIVSTINQHIIDTAPAAHAAAGSFPWSLLLSVLRDAETVVEVASQYVLGESGKWNYLIATEAAKAFVRLGAFRDAGFRMLLGGGETANEEKKILPPHPDDSDETMDKPSISSIWCGEGFQGRIFLVGETICILRPVVYVMFIRKFGVRSWIPWAASLALDLTSMALLSLAASAVATQQSDVEKDELRRRKLMWALYLIRDPFFTKFTKHRLEKLDGVLASVPLVGFLSNKVIELLLGVQTRYTYTSGS